MTEDELFTDLETAAGVPLAPDLRIAILGYIQADDWKPMPVPNKKQTVKLWTGIAKHAGAIIGLLESEGGRSLAAHRVLATFADYRSKGWLPDQLPQTRLVTDGLEWDQWWKVTKDLIETIELTAIHQADRAASDRTGVYGRRPLATANAVRDHLTTIYHHAVADFRRRGGVGSDDHEERFVAAVSSYLPPRLRGQSPEANASRKRKTDATRKRRAKSGSGGAKS